MTYSSFMKIRLENLSDDLSFARRVIDNEKKPVLFFLTDFSKPLLEYIGRCILKLPPAEIYHSGENSFTEYSYSVGCSSLYYKFIAEAFPEAADFLPQWDRLRYYEQTGTARLVTYLNVITTRYFYRHHPDTFDDTNEEQRKLKGERRSGKDIDPDLLHSYDDSERLYLLLCAKLQDKDEEVDFSEEMYAELEVARKMLKEKFAKVVEYCYFSNLPTMEIAERMRDDFETDPRLMSRKDIQTRISQWKNRAIASLTNIILNDKNKQLFPNMRTFISNHK